MNDADLLKDIIKHIKDQIKEAKVELATAVKLYNIYGMYEDCGPSYQDGVTRAEAKLETLIDQKIMVEKYRKQSDSVALFVEDIGLTVSATDLLPLKDLYDLYRTYCKENGLVSCSNRVFSDRLRQNGFTIVRRNYGRLVHANR
jgi:hypothetical protein